MKIKNLILTASFAVVAFAANAQDNVVKLGLPGFAFGQANVYYERMLTPRMSVNVQLGYSWGADISSQVKTQSDNRGASTSNNPSSINLTTGKFDGGFQIAPELRFYTGDKEGPRGFYIGPRLNYSSFTATLKGTHTYGSPAKTSDDKVVLNYNNIGLGVQMGYQWLINDQISIDWGFLGAGAGLGTITGTGTTDDTAELTRWTADANDFAASNAALKFLGVNKDGNSLTVKGSNVFPTFRSSLTIGYAF